MTKTELYACYTDILKDELMPALGCTEPIAIALAAAKAAELLGKKPEKAEICCSGNIIKNVKSVTVPNSGDEKGVLIAAALGICGGRSEKLLEVLTEVDDNDRAEAKCLAESGIMTCSLKTGEGNLYVSVALEAGNETATAVICGSHTNFIYIEHNGEVILDKRNAESGDDSHNKKQYLNIHDIIDYANNTDLTEIAPYLERQLKLNYEISNYGLEHHCGAEVGRTLMACDQSLRTRARARAAAGSDARMSGCTLPVVINSGSGNQGITTSMPVLEYAMEMKVEREKLYRALLVSNLVAVHQKYFIGNLSAFCGAVSAGAGAGAAITYLCGGDEAAICGTITNAICTAGGIFCDGAKSSCASKIAAAVDCAIMGHEMSMRGLRFAPGEGLMQDTPEKTIESVGYVGKVGMKETDEVILNIMVSNI